ncbi:MAG: ABC transporter ATP-binding protein [Deltaproteobacteria bacterium]|nr:ABC transporter ATP-binding protein [Deltaproteobacteria bacterium]MBW2154606.1 ABC transporter ATP-binding protein [Deltaproteobacteria bacterium]
MVKNVNLSVSTGKPLTLIGETGCGKTLVAQVLLGLLPQGMTASGQILYKGCNIINLPDHHKTRLWGREIFLFPQEPVMALNPAMRASNQVKEIFRWIKGLNRGWSGRAVSETFLSVGLASEKDRLLYPHQMSGGMRQRLVAAMAMAEPARLIVADEPTKGLDSDLRKVVIDQLKSLIDRGKSLFTITHDIEVAREISGWLAVMYAGRIMELGPCAEVLRNPLHPYTVALLGALPANGLQPIPFRVKGRKISEGCVFSDRCTLAMEKCFELAPESAILPTRGQCACFYCQG